MFKDEANHSPFLSSIRGRIPNVRASFHTKNQVRCYQDEVRHRSKLPDTDPCTLLFPTVKYRPRHTRYKNSELDYSLSMIFSYTRMNGCVPSDHPFSIGASSTSCTTQSHGVTGWQPGLPHHGRHGESWVSWPYG